MSGQDQVKGHNEAFSPFGLSGQLDGLQGDHTHPKCWIDVHKGYCIGMKGILTKGQGQSPVPPNSGLRIWCKILKKNLTRYLPDSYDNTSYLPSHWSDFSGYCIISWNLNLMKPDQAHSQDFIQEGANLSWGQGSPYQKPKLLRFGPLFFWVRPN